MMIFHCFEDFAMINPIKPNIALVNNVKYELALLFSRDT